MKKVTILHNPRCSKSRQTLALLQEQGIEPSVIEYLKTPLGEAELRDIYNMLNVERVIDMMRTKEDAYKAFVASTPQPEDSDLFAAMVSEPKLLERPVVICEGKARIGRPPENVLEIL